MQLVIKIDCGNDAFVEHPESEVARILKEYSERLEVGHDFERVLYDYNGGRVGQAAMIGK